MSLLENTRRFGSGLLGLINGLPGALAPGMNSPVGDPSLEGSLDPATLAAIKQRYKRQYIAQMAQAAQGGAPAYALDATASTAAQKPYDEDVMRAVQAAQFMREQRTQSGRTAAIQQMINGEKDPQKRALMQAADPNQLTEQLLRQQFPPNRSGTIVPVSNGYTWTDAQGNPVLDENGVPRFVTTNDPAKAAAAQRPIIKQEGEDLVYRDPQTLVELMRIPGGASHTYKPTDGQLLSSGFASRMVNAAKGIDQLSYTPTTKDMVLFQKILDGGPMVQSEVNKLLTPQARQYWQYLQDFSRAKLRKESGAVIGRDEIIGDLTTFFPLPGDDENTLAQKRAARGIAINAVITASGSAWKNGPYEADAAPRRFTVTKVVPGQGK